MNGVGTTKVFRKDSSENHLENNMIPLEFYEVQKNKRLYIPFCLVLFNFFETN